MKSLLHFSALALTVLLTLTACKHDGVAIPAPIVAPAGPASQAVGPAITAVGAEHAAALSKIAASAGAIREINAGQPEGPRTDGVANETDLIQELAGQPKPEDQLAASERARIVAEGKADEIAKAYAKATSEAAQQRAKADAATAALEQARAAAAAEQASLQAKYQAEINRLVAEANARVAAAVKEAQDKARAEQRRMITLLTFGIGALLIAGGVVVLMTSTSVPMFGPKAGFSLIAAGGVLVGLGITITQIQNFLELHPWVTGWALGISAVGAVTAAVLMYANQQHASAPAVAVKP